MSDIKKVSVGLILAGYFAYEKVTFKIGKTTFFNDKFFFTFYVVSPLIFKLEKATMYQIGSNVTRILQNLTVFGYLLSIARVLVLEASPPFLHPLKKGCK